MTHRTLSSARGLLRASLPLFLAIFIAATAAVAQFRNIYGDPSDARADLHAALEQAAREHKRILLDFGGNWCGDCQVLNLYLHQEPNAKLLADHFILVDVNIGRYDRNQDLAAKYEIPLRLGVPALAVLDAHGRLLYSQKNGEFESMRRMDSAVVTQFLERWQGPSRRG